MGIKIGEMFYRTRKELRLEQKEVCQGICTVSNYSNYENEERIPDFLTLNAILERFGMGFKSLSIYVSEKEMRYLRWKNKIENLIRKGEFIEVENLMKKQNLETSLNSRMQQQFLFYVNGVIAENVLHKEEEALEWYEKALRSTCSFLLDAENLEGRIGKFEIYIYVLYERLRIKQAAEKENGIRKLEQVCNYIVSAIRDKEEQVKSYPYIVCVLEQIRKENIHEDGKNVILAAQQEQRLEKAYQMLKECRYMCHMTEVLRLLVKIKKEQRKEVGSLQTDYETLCKVYKMFDESSDFQLYAVCKNVYMCATLGEYLLKTRKKIGISQEKISEMICEPESYSRIERGKSKPARKKYQAIAEKLEIEPRYYMEILNTGNQNALLLRRKFSEAVFEDDLTRSKILLSQLEKELGEEKDINQQFLRSMNAYLKYETGTFPLSDRKQELEEILSLTLDISDMGRDRHIYTKLEINLINHLAGVYESLEEYEKGIRLLKDFLQDMIREEGDVEYRFRETYLAALNLNKLLSDVGKYQEGNRLCRLWGKKAVEVGHGELLDDYIMEIGYNMEHMDEKLWKKSEETMRLAFAFSNIYGTKKNQKLIKAYLDSRGIVV